MSQTSLPPQCPKCRAPVPPEAPQGLCPKCLLAAVVLPTEAGENPGHRPLPPSLASVAAAFPQLEIVELIGQGGMGIVFKARQPKLDRWVALKLLPRSLTADPAFAERFTREGRVLARLSHPNIVAVHDFGQSDEFFYLIMEYVDGVNLRQAMRAGRFTPAQALAVVPRICDALEYAHGEGILHRDIKPENILLDGRGRVKIADFGIAKLMGDSRGEQSLTASGAALGTPHYMSPEQIEKPADVDHRADIYSLGVVFYEMLTGELPLGRFAPPSKKTPMDPRVDDVVFRALEKERDQRFQSAGEVRTRVEQITSSPPPAGPIPSVDPAAASPVTISAFARGWSRWALGAAAVAVLFLFMVPAIPFVARGLGPFELLFIFVTSAPFGLGATFLGWIGLREIRRSPVPLRGLRLATFGLLCWPFFLLDAGLLTIWIGLTKAFVQPHVMPVVELMGVIALITSDVFAGAMLVRWIRKNPPRQTSVQPLIPLWVRNTAIALVLVVAVVITGFMALRFVNLRRREAAVASVEVSLNPAETYVVTPPASTDPYLSAYGATPVAPGTRDFTFRHLLATEAAEATAPILLQRPGRSAKPSADNRTLTVTAPDDELRRVAVALFVADWPTPVRNGAEGSDDVVSAARSFFQACALFDPANSSTAKPVEEMLSTAVRSRMREKNVSIEQVSTAWMEHSLTQLRLRPGISATIDGKVREWVSCTFEGVPDFQELSFVQEYDGYEFGSSTNLPPDAQKSPRRLDALPSWMGNVRR